MEFEEMFKTKQDCIDYITSIRWPHGFECPVCGSIRYWKKNKGRFECRDCHTETTVTNGTIFHKSTKPLLIWFWAIWWMIAQKNGVSAKGLQKVLGLGSYRTSWTWLHKFRRLMVLSGRAKLAGTVEVDEVMVGGKTFGKRGSGAEGKSLIAVAVEVKGRKTGRVRLAKISDASSDSLRAIDYLCSRPEIDQKRIGATGNSGGGTQTMYLMGLDPRIRVAVLSCCLQTRERMFTLNGPADGCHHIAGEGLNMIEYSDNLINFAPKPTLILAGEKDNLFDINAVSFTVREAKWFYKELGVLDHIDLFTTNLGHGYHKQLREAAVWWFKKWLMNDVRNVNEPEMTLQNEEKLQATKTGQVMTEFPNERSLVDINIQLANNFKNQRKIFWKNNSKQNCISKVKELINYRDYPDTINVKAIYVGDINENDFLIQKLQIVSRDGFPLPALMYVPKNNFNLLPAALYLDDNGKSGFGADSIVNNLVKSGRIVIAVDLRGFGETEDNPGRLREGLNKWNSDHRIVQTSLHIGRPLIGQRVEDAIDVLNYIFTNPMIEKSDIELIGVGNCGIIALHAAAIDSRVSSVKLIHSISSWMDIIQEPLARNQLKNVIPGALKYYDLPDLKNSILPRPVKIIEPVNTYGKIIN